MFRMLLHIPAKTLFAAIGHLASIVYGYRTFRMTGPDFMTMGRAVQGGVLLGWSGRAAPDVGGGSGWFDAGERDRGGE